MALVVDLGYGFRCPVSVVEANVHTRLHEDLTSAHRLDINFQVSASPLISGVCLAIDFGFYFGDVDGDDDASAHAYLSCLLLLKHLG